MARADLSAAGEVVMTTVPAGERWVIKWASLVNTATDPGICYVGIRTGVLGYQLVIYERVAEQGMLYTTGPAYAVADAGDDLVVSVGSTTGGLAFVHVGGIVFEL